MVKQEPIIQSLLDTDFYKFTMGQLVFHRYPYVPVKYAFTNRTKSVLLADFISEEDLCRELDHARTLRFNKTELHYLRGTNEYSDRMFKEDYLGFLCEFQLPRYNLDVRDGQFILEFQGAWSEAIYWETIALAIINELYYRSLLSKMSRFEQEVVFAEGRKRLAEKIAKLRQYPEITFCDFGTRRRFSRAWQDYVVGVMAEELPDQMLGTSNTYLASKHGLLPMGTSAHETFMVMSGIMGEHEESIRASHNQVLREWWDEYGFGLSVALADTYGTDFFFRDMTEEQARNWKGLRQDSGNPFEFGEKSIAFYKKFGIDPKTKMIVFSDGLDVDTIIALHQRFRGRIKTTFGWGTNLTNDLGLKALSLVVKAVSANGRGLVKLSDNIAKAIGNPIDVMFFKQIFGHDVTTFEECKY